MSRLRILGESYLRLGWIDWKKVNEMKDERWNKIKKEYYMEQGETPGKQTNEFRTAITESGNHRQQSDESPTRPLWNLARQPWLKDDMSEIWHSCSFPDLELCDYIILTSSCCLKQGNFKPKIHKIESWTNETVLIYISMNLIYMFPTESKKNHPTPAWTNPYQTMLIAITIIHVVPIPSIQPHRKVDKLPRRLLNTRQLTRQRLLTELILHNHSKSVHNSYPTCKKGEKDIPVQA